MLPESALQVGEAGAHVLARRPILFSGISQRFPWPRLHWQQLSPTSATRMPNKKLIPVRSHLFLAAGCLAAIAAWPLGAQVPGSSPVSTATPAATPIPTSVPGATPVFSPVPPALPQLPGSPMAPTQETSPAPSPDAGLQALPQTPDLSPGPSSAGPVAPTQTPIKHSPTTEPGDPALNTSNSFWLDNYPLNDLYQYLARQAGYQFFQNPFIDAVRVTGELFKDRDPLANMRELALQYNLVLFQKGRTLYALTQDQITTLPQQDYRYELKYLHPRPEDIQRMLGHFLTPDHGSASLEPQINTIVVSDNETVIPKIARYLRSIDVPRRQISVQVRVISITSTGNKNLGVDWSSTLGQNGLSLSGTVQTNLDAAFGLVPFRVFSPLTNATTAPSLTNGGTNVILGPVTVTAVLHALLANGRVHEESAPLVITEDNQTSTVRVVNRTPIITSTVTVTNGVSDITNEVRYYLDPSDVAKNREIGTTLYVTPSILPDNTIRLQIDGTVSTIVGETPAPTSLGAGAIINNYPIVNEAHLVNLSRVPSGYSLILGGFVSVDNSVQNNRVPILGSLPLLGQAFRYKSVSRTRTNLAFVITPIAFQAAKPDRAVAVSGYNQATLIGPERDISDPDLIGRVNDNATDFHNAISTGQSEDKNPVTRRKQSKPKKQPSGQTQSANPDDQ
jgi:Bacterial type II and III secretion system protein